MISDSDANCSSQGKKMGGSAHLSYTLAALLASGGAYAFVRKGSKISLAAGCGVGALFAGSGRQYVAIFNFGKLIFAVSRAFDKCRTSQRRSWSCSCFLSPPAWRNGAQGSQNREIFSSRPGSQYRRCLQHISGKESF